MKRGNARKRLAEKSRQSFLVFRGSLGSQWNTRYPCGFAFRSVPHSSENTAHGEIICQKGKKQTTLKPPGETSRLDPKTAVWYVKYIGKWPWRKSGTPRNRQVLLRIRLYRKKMVESGWSQFWKKASAWDANYIPITGSPSVALICKIHRKRRLITKP